MDAQSISIAIIIVAVAFGTKCCLPRSSSLDQLASACQGVSRHDCRARALAAGY